MVPHSTDLREEILREFHCSRFAVHSGGTKIYQGSSSSVLLERDDETLMGPSRRDQCVFWIVMIRFCDARP